MKNLEVLYRLVKDKKGRVIKKLYEALDSNPQTNMISLYDNYLLEGNSVASEQSIVIAYYNFLCSHPELLTNGESAEEMAIDFAMELKIIVTMADMYYMLASEYLMFKGYVDKDGRSINIDAVVDSVYLRENKFNNLYDLVIKTINKDFPFSALLKIIIK